jgi:hypothetical protein
VERTGQAAGGRFLSVLAIALLPLALILSADGAWAAELQIPAIKAKPGQEIVVPLVIDQIANLAGVKVILNYDKEILTFREGNKSPATQSLMHIINDKTPGRLIVVMAGARGIQGKEVTILMLGFGVKKGLPAGHTTVIEISEVQLMGDDLKEVECKAKPGTITIQP